MAIDQTELERLIRLRDEFLAQHPHLRPLQAEINRVLAEAGADPARRLQAIFEMLLDQCREELLPATRELMDLQKRLDGLDDKIETTRQSAGRLKKAR